MIENHWTYWSLKFRTPSLLGGFQSCCRVVKKEMRFMVEMTKEMNTCFNTMDDKQKIRMFYELAKYIVNNTGDTEDEELNQLFSDIQNIVTDIENL